MYLDLLKALYNEENKLNENDKNGFEKAIMIVEQQQKQKYYWKMYDYIFKNASEEELKEHYNWYKTSDKTDLLNTMFESYCDNYDIFELEQRIKDLESESD